jgi:hypothetical protein
LSNACEDPHHTHGERYGPCGQATNQDLRERDVAFFSETIFFLLSEGDNFFIKQQNSPIRWIYLDMEERDRFACGCFQQVQ